MLEICDLLVHILPPDVATDLLQRLRQHGVQSCKGLTTSLDLLGTQAPIWICCQDMQQVCPLGEEGQHVDVVADVALEGEATSRGLLPILFHRGAQNEAHDLPVVRHEAPVLPGPAE